MSHFNEDKDGHLSNPTQKTLANFIISGDASGKNVGEHSLLGSDTSDSHFMVDLENDLSSDTMRHVIMCLKTRWTATYYQILITVILI